MFNNLSLVQLLGKNLVSSLIKTIFKNTHVHIKPNEKN